VRGGGTGIAESAVAGDEGVEFSEEVAGCAEAAGAEGTIVDWTFWKGAVAGAGCCSINIAKETLTL
jgi:hypothetical protein